MPLVIAQPDPIGPEGPAGQDGAPGPTGERGPQGDQGPIGPIGPQGPVGRDGKDGAAGPQGVTGPQGPAGRDGRDGQPGLHGDIGPQGEVGPQGETGPAGPIGPQGVQGEVGPTGERGLRGFKGVKGDTGPRGPRGESFVGPQGLPGDDGLDAVPNTASPPLEIVGDDIRFQTVEPGEVIGVPINGASGQPTQLTPRQHGAAIRRNEVQAITLTAGAGSGSGGEFTDADIILNAEATELRITTAGTGDVLIAGIDSENISGHTVTIDYFTGNHTVQKIRFLHNSGEASSGRSFICPTENGSGIDFELSQRFSTAQIGNSGGFWRILGSAQFPFGNSSSNSEFDVQIVDSGGRWRSRRLAPNDLDWPVIFVTQESDLPAAVGGVITIPNGARVWVDGLVTITAGTRFAVGENVTMYGTDRATDGFLFNVAAPAITVGADPMSFGMLDMTCNNSNASGDILAMADTLASRVTLSRVVALAAGGRGFDIAASNINIESLNLQGVSTGVTLTGSGSVFVIDGAALIQSVGGTDNGLVDLGSTTWDFIRVNSTFVVTAANGFAVKGVTASGNVNANGSARITEMTFVGAGTPTENITRDDLQWILADCSGMQNSAFNGTYTMSGNATSTVISTANVFTLIAGTTVEGTVHRMNMSANNQMTIDRLETSDYVIDGLISLSKAGGATSYSVAIFVNGVQAGAEMTREVTTVTGFMSVKALATLSTDDVVDVRIRNNDGTADVLIEAMTVVITGTR